MQFSHCAKYKLKNIKKGEGGLAYKTRGRGGRVRGKYD